jgi:DNA primase
VTRIEDVREAKRREVVERAKELLTESFDDTVMNSADILAEVREAVRVEDITEFHGLPAGPRVADGDAVIVVEGRADVLTLLRYGVKNAVAVEGTNVPDAVAELTRDPDRTVTAFLDGDRGGELVLRELAQVGDVDYVAFAPEGLSVEDLDRHQVMAALRGKVPLSSLPDEGNLREAVETTNGSLSPPEPRAASGTTGEREAPAGPDASDDAGRTRPGESRPTARDAGEPDRDGDGLARSGTADAAATDAATGVDDRASDAGTATRGTAADAGGSLDPPDGTAGGEREGSSPGTDAPTGEATEGPGRGDESAGSEAGDEEADAEDAEDADGEDEADADPASLPEHVREVVDGSGLVRLLDREMGVLDEADAGEAFEALRDAEAVPYAVVLDGELSQRVLDVAAQRGVEQIVAGATGEFVKQPIDVRVRTAEQLVATR